MKRSLGKILLTFGIISPLIRIVNDLIAASIYPGYNIINQSISQLAAVGAPTRSFQMILFIVEVILTTFFGIGVLMSSGKKRPLKICGVLLTLFGVLLAVELLFPQASMQLSGGNAAQLVHLIITGGNVVIILLFIGFGAAAFGKRFRFYSIATVLTMFIFAAIAGTRAAQAVDFSAPWMGIAERVNYYSYLIWIIVFANILLRIAKKPVQGEIQPI